MRINWDRFWNMFECKLYIWGILYDPKSWKASWWKVRYKLLKENKI